MKTKRQTKERKQLRDVDSALKDCKSEFGSVYDDYDVLDEVALSALAEIEEMGDDE